jgi:hypothetical protein
MIIEVRKGDISSEKLTICQQAAARGLYAQTTAAYVRWLAPRLDEVRAEFQQLRNEMRERLERGHPRTADIEAQLIAAYTVYATFLKSAGALDDAGAERLLGRVSMALKQAGDAQAQYALRGEPCGAFLRLLRSALTAGVAHLTNPDGVEPRTEDSSGKFTFLGKACGWREDATSMSVSCPQGARVGWLDGDDLYLDRDASYQAAERMAVNGDGIEVTSFTLARRLKQAGLLVSTDLANETLTIRKTLGGARIDVLHLRAGQTLGVGP